VVGVSLLSVEQKAAVARRRDVTGRSGSLVAPPGPPAHPEARPRAQSSAEALSTRSELLLAASLAHPPNMPSIVATWRTRSLQAQVEQLHRELAASEAAAAVLREKLAAAEAREAQRREVSMASPARELPMYDNALYENGCSHPAGAEGSTQESECVEECEPGVYVTISAGKVLRRVRFDKRRFSDERAAEWWAANQQSVMARMALVLPVSRSRRTQSADLT